MTDVLVVDDSAFVRRVVGDLLTERGFTVSTAATGREAVDVVTRETPDVVTMDVRMPEMNGIEATERIMETAPTPVVVLSAHTESSAEATLKILARGAVDFIEKPGGDDDIDVEELGEHLERTVEVVAGADPSALVSTRTRAGLRAMDGTRARRRETDGDSGRDPTPTATPDPVDVDVDIDPKSGTRPGSGPATVVVGASTGGPKVVERTLAALPIGLNARVLIVQHMPPSFTGRFADRLDGLCAYDVDEATSVGTVGADEAVVARGNRHLEVTGTEGGDDGTRLQVELTREPRVHGVRPAADVTMRSAAEMVPGRLVGVVLTGMGRDGTVGLEAIRACGGATLAQDEATSPVFGMPREAIDAGVVDRVVPAQGLAQAICDAVFDRDTENERVHI
jgi:two-component system chemotaxis response regulator CheB